jgi:hypothetical protein
LAAIENLFAADAKGQALRAPSGREALFLVRVLFILTFCCSYARCEQLYYMQPITARASPGFPESLVKALRPQGFQVFTGSKNAKTVICEVFLARTVAAEDIPRQSSKTLYGRLKPGSLVGAIHFLAAQQYVRQYRMQVFKAGYYTMRYAVNPQGANETGLVDFVLLSQVRADPVPSQTIALKELVRRARLASDSGRPATMSLVESDTDQSFPSLTTDDEGTCVLQVKIPMKARNGTRGQELPLALVVITAIPEDLGD